MANNAGGYIPTTVNYVKMREALHDTFQKAVAFTATRFGRPEKRPVPLPAPSQGVSPTMPARSLGPAFGNASTRRFLY